MFITRIFQEILSLTPFFAPTMERFYKGADKDGFLSRFPVFGLLLNVVPPLKWIDSKFKYPILTFGRIAVCGFLIWNLVSFTNTNEDYKTFVNNQVINRIFPQPVKQEAKKINTGNFINDNTENFKNYTSNETNYLIENVKTGTSQNLLKEFFYGATGTIVRAPVMFLLYSLLFFIFGHTTAQLDAKALSRLSGVRGIGESFIKNIGKYIPSEELAVLNKQFGSVKADKLMYDANYQRKIMEIIEG